MTGAPLCWRQQTVSFDDVGVAAPVAFLVQSRRTAAAVFRLNRGGGTCSSSSLRDHEPTNASCRPVDFVKRIDDAFQEKEWRRETKRNDFFAEIAGRVSIVPIEFSVFFTK